MQTENEPIIKNIEGNENKFSQAIRMTAFVFVIFLLQHYFRRFGQPIETIYFTIFFDSIALTGLTMITLSYLLGPLARFWPTKWNQYLPLRKYFGLIGLVFVVIHVFLALAIFNLVYYPKFFAATGKLSASGEFSILAGTIGLVILLIIAVTSLLSVAEKMSLRAWVIVQRFV